MKFNVHFSVFIFCLSFMVNGQKVKGISFVGTKEKVRLEQLIPVQQIGANWVTLMPFGYLASAQDSVLRFDTTWQWNGETSAGLEETIPLFAGANINVMLKPQIWISKGVYTGKIAPPNEQAWRKLTFTYRVFILHFAQLAQKHCLPLYCIGTELSSMVERDPQFWRELIHEVRKVYHGKLVYAENWDKYEQVPFWDALDYIGINAYFPFKGDNLNSIEDIKSQWTQLSQPMQAMSKALDRQILFTEMGYRSVTDPLSQPWDYRKVQAYDPAMQAMALTALLDYFMPQPWWKGGFIWKWFPDHLNAGGEDHTGFTPQNKTAQKVLETYFTNRK